jgi:hypothetical protein
MAIHRRAHVNTDTNTYARKDGDDGRNGNGIAHCQ